MLVTFATVGLLVWLIVCGIFLGLIPDAIPAENAGEGIAPALADDARESVPAMAAVHPQLVPVELLVYRLEDYIRTEEAAAQSYLLEPCRDTLHAGSHNITVN